jgi:hypothetical protein
MMREACSAPSTGNSLGGVEDGDAEMKKTAGWRGWQSRPPAPSNEDRRREPSTKTMNYTTDDEIGISHYCTALEVDVTLIDTTLYTR